MSLFEAASTPPTQSRSVWVSALHLVSAGNRFPLTPQSSKVTPLHAQLTLDPQPLPLHDVPELAQVGLGDDVVGLEPQRPQVVGLGLGQPPVEVEDGAEVHEGGGVLRRKSGRVRTAGESEEFIFPE